MTVRFLLVEDESYRSLGFTDAVRFLERQPRVAGQVEVTTATSVLDLSLDEPESLAPYDVVLVDFSLNTLRHCRAAGVAVPAIELHEVPGYRVPVVTGMGVLLWIADAIGTPAYAAARRAAVKDHPRRLGRPHLITFTQLSGMEGATQARLFASSAREWFGTSHMDARDAVQTAEALQHIKNVVQSGESSLVLDDPQRDQLSWAEEPFRTMMDRHYCEQVDWNKDGGVSSEAYDWYAMYLLAGGKAGVLKKAMKLNATIADRWGVSPRWKNPTTQIASQMGTPLQEGLMRYLAAFSSSADAGSSDESKWQVGDADDPMLEALNEARAFWLSDDVRAALVFHRLRSGGVVPPEPLGGGRHG